jgi:hypothetical protein
MTKVHFNTAFDGMSEKDINTWIMLYRKRLIGSAVFTLNNSFTSKLVRWAENWGKSKERFTPSHTGSIIEKEGMLYIFNMCPPRAYIQPLTNYILYSKDTYAIVIRDFPLSTKMFSANILYHLGEFYPYLPALRSVFTKRKSKWRNHCSELHLIELQKQGLYKDINPEITPAELYELLTK